MIRIVAVVVAAVLLSACGAESAAQPEPTPVPAPAVPSSKPEPEPKPKPGFKFECATLGTTIDQLPERWNAYIDESGSGFKLPESIEATGTVLGLSKYTQFLDGMQSNLSAISVYWHPESGQVREIIIYGDVAISSALTLRLIYTAGAMVYSATEMSVAEAEEFLGDRLMVGINELKPGGFINDLVEEDDRAFRFNVAGSGADWSAVGSRSCP